MGEVARYFFRLGCIAFGGPAAHLALMRRELVRERRWATDQELMDLLGAANLIPGPNSTELAMLLGAKRAGWRGLFPAGFAFIFPAVAIVLAIAWAYVRYGGTPAGEGLIAGIQPFILAIIVQAIWGLRGAAVKGRATAVMGAAVLILAVLGVSQVLLIFGAGLAMVLFRAVTPRPPGGQPDRWRPLRSGGGLANAARRGRGVVRRIARAASPVRGFAMFAAVPAPYSAWDLLLVFLKIGTVLYGGGYVLAAFLQVDLVDQRHWLTDQQVIDAIAVGQFTPGPLFSSATFAGYIVDGWRGALLATVGIFLPSFVLVTVTHPLVPKLRQWSWTAPFLDGVNVAALALMALVTMTLAQSTLDNAFAISLFAIATTVLLRFNPNSAWLVLAGAAVGLLRAWLW